MVFKESGSWTENSTYTFGQSQSGTTSATWSDSGMITYVTGTFGSTITGSYNNSGTDTESFGATVSVTYSPQHAFNSFTSYQAGSWSNGSYSFSSVTYDGTGNLNWNMTSNETWGATGGGNINDSSSGIGTSGVQGNSNYTFTSNYNFSGSAGGSGNYNLHEEGNFGNGTYALGCMSYAVSGAANNSEGYGGTDSETGTSPGVNYSGSDNYSGSANGNSNYTLTEQGQYASGVWTISQFTESETTVTSANYSGAGQFSGSGPGGAYQGNYTYTDSGSSNFGLYGQGNYANGSFSFQTFSANLVAGVSTSYSEAGSNAAYISYSRSDSASHNISLAETGHNQTGIYTLTVTDSSSHSFYAQPRFGQPISYSSSGSVSTTTYGTFNLAGGNPYLPYAGNVGQAGGQGVGILTPWYTRTTGAGEGGHGMAAGGNRVTYSLPKIQGERVEPVWGNGAATDGYSSDAGFGALGGDLGLPPSSSDEPNLGLPAGPNGTGDPSYSAFSFGPGLIGTGPSLTPAVAALRPPQPAPDNWPYALSTQDNAWNCLCASVESHSLPDGRFSLGNKIYSNWQKAPKGSGIDWGKIWQNVKDVGQAAFYLSPVGLVKFGYDVRQLDAQGKADVAGALIGAPGNVINGYGRRAGGILNSIAHLPTTAKEIWGNIKDFASSPPGYIKELVVKNLLHFQNDPADYMTGVSFNAAAAAAMLKVSGAGGGAMRARGLATLEELGLGDVELAGKSFNAGRRALEKAGFVLEEVTETGRKVFRNPRTGALVFYDSGKALTKSQKAHWHIRDRAGRCYDRSGRVVGPEENAGHIPGG